MVLSRIGEFLTTISVNGTDQSSYDQNSNSSYDVSVGIDNSNKTRVTVFDESISDLDSVEGDPNIRFSNGLSWTVPPEFDGFTGSVTASATADGQTTVNEITTPFTAGETAKASYDNGLSDFSGSASLTVKVDIPLNPQVSVGTVNKS
jgi:hypothetical protein